MQSVTRAPRKFSTNTKPRVTFTNWQSNGFGSVEIMFLFYTSTFVPQRHPLFKRTEIGIERFHLKKAQCGTNRQVRTAWMDTWGDAMHDEYERDRATAGSESEGPTAKENVFPKFLNDICTIISFVHFWGVSRHTHDLEMILPELCGTRRDTFLERHLWKAKVGGGRLGWNQGVLPM